MKNLGKVLVVAVALEHVWFMVLEMFLFNKPIGLETFHNTQAAADTCVVLAKNQGLYNGFLAATLITAVVTNSVGMRRLGLACVMVAGVFGAATADPKILFAQTIPAAIVLALTEFTGRSAPASASR